MHAVIGSNIKSLIMPMRRVNSSLMYKMCAFFIGQRSRLIFFLDRVDRNILNLHIETKKKTRKKHTSKIGIGMLVLI